MKKFNVFIKNKYIEYSEVNAATLYGMSSKMANVFIQYKHIGYLRQDTMYKSIIYPPTNNGKINGSAAFILGTKSNGGIEVLNNGCDPTFDRNLIVRENAPYRCRLN